MHVRENIIYKMDSQDTDNTNACERTNKILCIYTHIHTYEKTTSQMVSWLHLIKYPGEHTLYSYMQQIIKPENTYLNNFMSPVYFL